jgi:hypothetical protein
MTFEGDELIRRLEAGIPAGGGLQPCIMELALLIQRQAEKVQRLQAVVDDALALLRQFPEDTLGRTACPGGGLQSNLSGLVADLERRGRLGP